MIAALPTMLTSLFGGGAAAAAAGGGVLFKRVHVRNRRLESVTGIQAVFIARLGNQTLED